LRFCGVDIGILSERVMWTGLSISPCGIGLRDDE
jgi:hypothetical protein